MMKHRLFLGLILSMLLGAPSLEASDTTAHGIPVPTEGVVTFHDGQTAKFTTTGGSPLIVRDEHTGVSYSFFSRQNDATGALEVKAIEGTRSGKSAWKSLSLDDSALWAGAKRATFRGSSFTVDFLPVTVGDRPSTGTVSGQPSLQFLKNDGICCVTCGPRTICAERVTLSCGSCIAGEWENSF
jgi:hypothetical protein